MLRIVGLTPSLGGCKTCNHIVQLFIFCKSNFAKVSNFLVFFTAHVILPVDYYDLFVESAPETGY